MLHNQTAQQTAQRSPHMAGVSNAPSSHHKENKTKHTSDYEFFYQTLSK